MKPKRKNPDNGYSFIKNLLAGCVGISILKELTIYTVAVLVAGCSSEVKRTRNSDKSLRIFLDANSVSENEYRSIQQSLADSGKFYVIDRNQAYKALKTEQERQHRTEADRFSDEQKYAHWGKLYGAGAVITAKSVCVPNYSQLNAFYLAFHLATLDIFWKPYKCTQFLDLVDTNTSEVVSSVRNDLSSNSRANLDWSDAVDELIAKYPETFQKIEKHQILKSYEAESKIEAQKQRGISSEK